MFANSRFIIATHALVLLARSDEPLASPWVASSIGVNPVTVRKVIKTLRDGGLVETISGSSGGARLARPKEQITLLDVYLCMRSGTVFGTFPENPNPDCLVGRNIQHVLDDIVDETERQMIEPLRDVTIASLLAGVHSREAMR